MTSFKELEHQGRAEKARFYDDHFAGVTCQAIGPMLEVPLIHEKKQKWRSHPWFQYASRPLHRGQVIFSTSRWLIATLGDSR